LFELHRSDLKAGSRIMPPQQARSGDPTEPVPFPFKVSWPCLYAKFPETSRSRALVKSDASKMRNRQAAASGAGWSMVVPRMQRQRPARVLEIAPATQTAPLPAKTVAAKELLAFFGPAAALAACLALLLIQFAPKWDVATPQPPGRPQAEIKSKPGAFPENPFPEIQTPAPVARARTEPAPVLVLPEPDRAPAITEPAVAEPRRVSELPELPAPPVRSAPVVYRPELAPQPPLMEGFESSRVLKKVKPIYPEIATAERVQGTVRLKAIIGKDGSVEKVVPESGPEMLYAAASDAVRQWTFYPARLNGDAVEDVIHINIGFAIVAPERAQR
jgi:TonB family protein